ncbi:twin-arginine translocase subunit TatB [Lysobacter sp. K5869]|uniref:Sec-independent protein translocase protein TatB n=1 Tax=Lysobacter sp. K5869 TaxID=2820808 RepID=UPI001C063B78|nr:twin-arginine translocase subunit TatB [Lysobacter sp. K5869]
MFDIGFSEVFVIAIVALIVLGPERLPKAARFAGLWVRRARAQWYSVKSELERELADEDLKRSLRAAQDELRSAQQQLRDSGQILREGADDLNQRVAAAGTSPAAAAQAQNESAAAPGDSTQSDPAHGDPSQVPHAHAAPEPSASNHAEPAPAAPAPAEPAHPDYYGANQPDYRPSTAQTPNDERR